MALFLLANTRTGDLRLLDSLAHTDYGFGLTFPLEFSRLQPECIVPE